MNIGHLKHESFVNAYKDLGFSARNHLIDAALELLIRQLANERRAEWRKAAHKEYATSKPGHVWESIEGEDFETT